MWLLLQPYSRAANRLHNALYETHQPLVKMHSNPQHLSQNGAVVVWAPMHQGCALLSDGCSRSATLYTTVHEPIDTDTNAERHFHANIQGLHNCAIAQMCTQRLIQNNIHRQRNSHWKWTLQITWFVSCSCPLNKFYSQTCWIINSSLCSVYPYPASFVQHV